MKRIALFPGSFDPLTMGHVSIVRRAIPLFDEIVIGVGINAQKKYMFDLDQRLNWIKGAFSDTPNVRVESYEGLTVDFCSSLNAQYILRGLRNQQDFEFERSIAQMNMKLNPNVETVFLFTELPFAAINSSIVRDIIRNGGNAKQFLPPNINL